jgi:hypothetical protein
MLFKDQTRARVASREPSALKCLHFPIRFNNLKEHRHQGRFGHHAAPKVGRANVIVFLAVLNGVLIRKYSIRNVTFPDHSIRMGAARGSNWAVGLDAGSGVRQGNAPDGRMADGQGGCWNSQLVVRVRAAVRANDGRMALRSLCQSCTV